VANRVLVLRALSAREPALLEMLDTEGRTPLLVSAEHSDRCVIEFFLKACVNPTVCGGNGDHVDDAVGETLPRNAVSQIDNSRREYLELTLLFSFAQTLSTSIVCSIYPPKYSTGRHRGSYDRDK
jgi:hypothetical protein